MTTGVRRTLLDRSLRHLIDEASREMLRRHRRSGWTARRSAEEETNLVSVLTDLAERRERLSLTTASGTQVSGIADAVGTDFVSITTPAALVLIPLRALAVITMQDKGSRGVRAAPQGPDLRSLLVTFAEERPSVRATMLCRERSSLEGTLTAVGSDVAVIERRHSGSRFTHYLALSSLSELFFAASG